MFFPSEHNIPKPDCEFTKGINASSPMELRSRFCKCWADLCVSRLGRGGPTHQLQEKHSYQNFFEKKKYTQNSKKLQRPKLSLQVGMVLKSSGKHI